MTKDFKETIIVDSKYLTIIVYDKCTMCSPQFFFAFKNGVSLSIMLNPNNGLVTLTVLLGC